MPRVGSKPKIDLALEFVRRFQAELTEMVERQRQVIDETGTSTLNATARSAAHEKRIAEKIAKLADEERRLGQLAKEHSELLFGLGSVRVSLEAAERRLAAAANMLDERETGSPAQQAERHALSRLEGMLEAFAQTANEAAPNPANPPGAGAPNAQPQRRPTFELLEVKMLRMLQVDLHVRTSDYQKRLADPRRPARPAAARRITA